MNIMMNDQLADLSLWPVRVRTGQLNLDPEVNAELARIAKEYSSAHMAHIDSGFKHNVTHNIYMHDPSPAVDVWFAKARELVELYLFEVAQITPADMTEPLFNCFGTQERRGRWTVPHAHHGNQVVITYYPEVIRDPEEPHPYAGSLFFQNPSYIQSGFWARKETGFTPIKVESGTVVIFPGYAPHSTSPFFCESSTKCALVTNVRFTGSLEGDNPLTGYAKVSAIEERREEMENKR
jgi:hypothetical protein